MFDLECNGLNPNTIYMISMTCLISGEKRTFVGVDEVPEAIAILADADALIGHSIRSFDCKVIEKLTENLIKFDQLKILDTVEMSRALARDMPNHKLATWGEILGIEKLEQPPFGEFTPAMIPYCERDVEVNVHIFYALIELLKEKHGTTIPLRWKIVEDYLRAKSESLQLLEG